MLLSTVAAGMLAVATAGYETVRLVQSRQWRAFLTCAAAAAAPLIAVLALIAALQYVDTASSGNPLVRLGLNRLAARGFTWAMFLNFGPVLVVALMGIVAAVWRRALGRFVPLAVILATCLMFYFYVDIPEHDSVYVAWRASHLAFIAFAALCAFALQEWWRSGGPIRWAAVVVVLVVALAALPTVLIDLYNTQDVGNRGMGPGFQWTVVLSPSELAALEWTRHHTLASARVQIEPFAHERDAYYVTAFAERRMAGGLPTGLIPLAKYQAVSEKIRGLFRSTSASDAHARAVSLCVDYLMIGEPERRAYPAFQPMMDAAPHFFRPAFRNDAIAIYAVPQEPRETSCAP
jgi:hypothetical protein